MIVQVKCVYTYKSTVVYTSCTKGGLFTFCFQYIESNWTRCWFVVTATLLPTHCHLHPFPFIYLFTFFFTALIGFMQSTGNTRKIMARHTYKLLAGIKYAQVYTNKKPLNPSWKTNSEIGEMEVERERRIPYVMLYMFFSLLYKSLSISLSLSLSDGSKKVLSVKWPNGGWKNISS